MARTDIFIRKPVLAIVVSALILLLGIRGEQLLPVRQFPRTVIAFVNVETIYYGADASVVAGFITTPIENAISKVDGVDYITSNSSTGDSVVQAHLRLNQDPDKVLTQIQTQISAVHNQLPPQSQSPSIRLISGGNVTNFNIAFQSDVMSEAQVNDYLIRVVQPQLQSVPGVQSARVFGRHYFALRAWIDPVKLAAHGLTAADVSAAMQNNNFTSGAGVTAGEMVQVPLGVTTGLHNVNDFRSLVIRQTHGAVIRLGDVAQVELGSDDYSFDLIANGKPEIAVGIEVVPTANILSVINDVRAKFEDIRRALPQGLTGQIVIDPTRNIRDSIREVVKTLLESLAIVSLVVLFFLRSARASAIPVITIPLSLIGTFGILWCLGFSINLLTLLALVLATGLVVDDAIIVVENVTREMADGASPLDAALRSARSLSGPIIAMTVVLIAVYVPIAVRAGLTGALFTEFALSLVGSVTVSAVLALTLSPMMCRFMLKPPAAGQGRDDRQLRTLQRLYRPVLRRALTLRWPVALFGICVLAGSWFLYTGLTSELAPPEDEGFVQMAGTVPPTGSIDMLRLYDQQIYRAVRSVPEADLGFEFEASGDVEGGTTLKPYGERKRNATAIASDLQKRLSSVAGENLAVFQPSPMPGSFGAMPVGYVLKTIRPFDELYLVSQRFLAEAKKTGMFRYIDADLKIDVPQATIVIDRNKVAALGLDLASIGATLNTFLSGGYVGYFDLDGHAYKVMPEVIRSARLNPDQIMDYTIASINGIPVPLSSVAHIDIATVPEQINHFQQMNASTISGIPQPGITQSEAMAALDKIAARVLPPDYATDTSGPLRQYVQESSGFAATFGLAIVVIYLSLAALFGSFRDPLIILVSVPMSVGGALLFIYFGVHGATLNIYSEVGLVTLMGLISKHGILMVEVANELQVLGRTKREAIEQAALLRLRPILMTTAAMVIGVAPLLLASGAGAASRFVMGLVIATGLSIGTLFTLFVVPAFYMLLARRHLAEGARAFGGPPGRGAAVVELVG